MVTGTPKTTPLAEHKPGSVFTVTFPGAVIDGFSLSSTVTNCKAVDTFPDVSDTVHVTVVTPVGKTPGASFVNE